VANAKVTVIPQRIIGNMMVSCSESLGTNQATLS